MATFKLRENVLSGQTGLSVRLYAKPGATIANGAGGDTLTETSSSDGEFTATVAETLTGLHDYSVYKSGNAIASGQVYCSGSTWTADDLLTVIQSQTDLIGTGLIVLPVTGTTVGRGVGTALTAYTNELVTFTVAVTDSTGASVDLSAMTLELVFESGATEVTILNAAITKASGSFGFTATSALTTAERLWKWALRKTDETVLLTGTLEVIYAANN